MRTSPLLPALPFLVVFGCLAPPSRPSGSGGSNSGGRATEPGGSGGNAGSGGTSSGGGITSSGGAAGSGGTSASGGTAGSGGTSSGGGVSSSGGQGSGGTAAGGSSGRAGDGGQGASNGGAGAGGTATGATAGTGGAAGGSSSTRGGSGGASTSSASGGRAGTGGSSGSGGATGTGGSTAPTACSFPSAWNPGSATYTTYTLPNTVTACGYNESGTSNTIKNIVNSANFAAIPGNTSSDFNTSSRCGACVQIGSAIITIVDECPNDSNAPCKANPTGHLDLSNAAANAGGVKGDPNVHGQTQWKFIPCPVTGNVMVRLKSGNSNEMFIENEILPIASVSCGGQTGSRTSYGAWHFGANIPGATCTVTDVANRTITVTAGSTQGQDVDTGKQFPKCL